MSFSDRSTSGSRGLRSERLLTKVAKFVLPNVGKKDKEIAEKPFFDPEELTSHKREWTRRFVDGSDSQHQPQWAEHLFEHFAIVGLSPTTNVRTVSTDIKTFHKVNRAGGAGIDIMPDGAKDKQQYGLKGPALPAEVMYSFPSDGLPPDLADQLAAFCFPNGVRPELLERTPSMSAMNEVIYSQPYQTHDDHSFVFLMKVADPTSVAPRTLYGVCCYMRELVHRPPAIAREVFPYCNAPLSRYMVVAPRCYCLLTHYPFFTLHFRVLQTILGLERLDRMTAFATELASGFPTPPASSCLPSEAGDSLGDENEITGGSAAAIAADAGSSVDTTSSASSPQYRPSRLGLQQYSSGTAADSTQYMAVPSDSVQSPMAARQSTMENGGSGGSPQPQKLQGQAQRGLGSAVHQSSPSPNAMGSPLGPLGASLAAHTWSPGGKGMLVTPAGSRPLPPTPFFTPYSPASFLGAGFGATTPFSSPAARRSGGGQQELPEAAELAASASNGLARMASVKRVLELSLVQAGSVEGTFPGPKSASGNAASGTSCQSMASGSDGNLQAFGSNIEQHLSLSLAQGSGCRGASEGSESPGSVQQQQQSDVTDGVAEPTPAAEGHFVPLAEAVGGSCSALQVSTARQPMQLLPAQQHQQQPSQEQHGDGSDPPENGVTCTMAAEARTDSPVSATASHNSLPPSDAASSPADRSLADSQGLCVESPLGGVNEGDDSGDDDACSESGSMASSFHTARSSTRLSAAPSSPSSPGLSAFGSAAAALVGDESPSPASTAWQARHERSMSGASPAPVFGDSRRESADSGAGQGDCQLLPSAVVFCSSPAGAAEAASPAATGPSPVQQGLQPQQQRRWVSSCGGSALAATSEQPVTQTVLPVEDAAQSEEPGTVAQPSPVPLTPVSETLTTAPVAGPEAPPLAPLPPPPPPQSKEAGVAAMVESDATAVSAVPEGEAQEEEHPCLRPVVGNGSPVKGGSFSSVEVQVSTNYSSPQLSHASLSRSNTPARADILSATPMHARQASYQGGVESEGSTPATPDGSPTHGGSRAKQEVVRVTASNLDLSRPLESLDLLSVYFGSVVPQPGQVFEFQPDPGLQSIAFERPDLLEAFKDLGLRPTASALPDIDAAQNLGGWTVAALCRSMSLDNILTFVTAALLERQLVVFCPNIGVLCGVVLSLVPMLLPFCWQSLLLPVLPAAQSRLEIIEAPVPFVLGVLYKTNEVRQRCSGLVRVNVYKDKVKNAGSLPQLPSGQELHDALMGTYSELRKIGQQRTAVTRPVYMVSDAQQVLAECFLSTLQNYLKSLMADLKAYTITDVTADNDRVSVLLKDSFTESFPPRDRPFMRQFAETQMFAVYCDAVIDNMTR